MAEEFPIERQTHSEWCWAAVAVSVDKYFDSNSTLSQCQVASLVTGKSCCAPGAGCNQAEALIDALKEINRLGETFQNPLSFERIQQELDAHRPVCVRIRWLGGGAHFVVITGYEILTSGARNVDVSDPLHPPSTIDFDELRTAYYGDGEWKDTYLVTNTGINPPPTITKGVRYGA